MSTQSHNPDGDQLNPEELNRMHHEALAVDTESPPYHNAGHNQLNNLNGRTTSGTLRSLF